MISPQKRSWIKQNASERAPAGVQLLQRAITSRGEIELESLSKELSGVSENRFSEFTAEKAMSWKSFPADRGTLRQLTKYAGSGGGLTML